MGEAVHAVTGAFGYSGGHIARRLLAEGVRVRTLTNSPGRRSGLGGRVDVRPLSFGEPEKLAADLAGVEVLYNTYWVRFNHRRFKFAEAVRNSAALFEAARRAGVRRIVHVSITNPSAESDLEYFSGKARVEAALEKTGMPHTILRPAVLFGGEDILINNIAWGLRRMPIFGVFGDGLYKLQPIHVEDFAALAVEQGKAKGSAVINAIGPETFTYRGLVETLAGILGVRRRVVGLPPRVAYAVTRVLGWVMGDVVLTWQEVLGLSRGLLCVDAAPVGRTRLTEWAREHRKELGVRYASELGRRVRGGVRGS